MIFNLIYRFVFALNATSWMVVVYGVKKEWNFIYESRVLTFLTLLCIPILLSILSLVLSTCFSMSKEEHVECKAIQLADQEFLPVYLGYFFVALSIDSCYTLIVVYSIVLVFSFLSQAQYFNPIFLLMRYHFYHLETKKGTRKFVIVRGRLISSPEEMQAIVLNRINDFSYISGRRK